MGRNRPAEDATQVGHNVTHATEHASCGEIDAPRVHGAGDPSVASVAPGPPPADPQDAEVLRALHGLVRETYQLWDHEWVGFSWRNYTYDHVCRVRNLALSLAAEEGVETRALDLAAVLHDVTKSYDGEVMMRDGRRVLDDDGLWRNEYLPPARANEVTRLYDALSLAGSVHHHSGARVADALLQGYGYPAALREHVAEIIVSHLRVSEASSVQGRCLYDADTIDANIGHPALYRNIQISMHRLEQQHTAEGISTNTYLATRLREHLHDFVITRWPQWVEGKLDDFVGRMATESGRRRALARIEHLRETLAAMREELDDFDAAIAHGSLAPVVHFVRGTRNPSLIDELCLLERRWPAGSRHAAGRFLGALRRESEGAW